VLELLLISKEKEKARHPKDALKKQTATGVTRKR
jgi:hypothetical protein